MSEAFAERAQERKVRSDIRVVAGMAAIYCSAHHKGRPRAPLNSEAATVGVYGRDAPRLCEECAAHVRYAEKRRAFCPKDPKPFCAHCETHCYKPNEAAWQRQMMRFSGPRAVLHGFAIPAIKHAFASCKSRRSDRRRARRPA